MGGVAFTCHSFYNQQIKKLFHVSIMRSLTMSYDINQMARKDFGKPKLVNSVKIG